jgi:hypothetical protein
MTKEYSLPAALSSIRSWRWLRLVIMQIKHETGDKHTAIELVLDPLRRGKVFARGRYRGEREPRMITDWNHLTIEVDRDSEDVYAIWLDARHGSEPAVTKIIILRGEKYFNVLWPQDAAPEQPKPEVTPPPPAHKARKANWQRDRVTPVVNKLYPPDGVVPKEIPIVVIYAKVCSALETAELEAGSKRRPIASPSIETVARAIGRRK